MRIAIVRTNGMIDTRIERTLVTSNFNGDFVDKVTRATILNYDILILSEQLAVQNMPKYIERIVLEKRIIVVLITKSLNIGTYYNIMNDKYFHMVQENEVHIALNTILSTAFKFIAITNNLMYENETLKRQITTMKNTNKAKRILMKKGLSEDKAHNFIQKKSMDMRISKNDLVNLIIENKIDI